MAPPKRPSWNTHVTLLSALAKDGIRSNTISPGYVWSGIFNGRIDMPGHDAMLEVVPMHRFGTNDEIASTVLFLASDASRTLLALTFA